VAISKLQNYKKNQKHFYSKIPSLLTILLTFITLNNSLLSQIHKYSKIAKNINLQQLNLIKLALERNMVALLTNLNTTPSLIIIYRPTISLIISSTTVQVLRITLNKRNLFVLLKKTDLEM
jgi:hypothetical protein